MDDEGYLGGHQADRRGKPGRHSRVPFTGTLGREGLVQLDAYWRDKSAPTVVS